MKRILLCGGTGFLGRNVLHRLFAQDYNIRAVYHDRQPPDGYDNVEWVQADLTCQEDVARVVDGVDVIIQLAAKNASGAKEGLEKPWLSVTDNAIMNSLLLREASKKQIEKFIFPSCTVMYQSSDTPIKEEDFDAGVDPYPKYFGQGWTKVYIEKMCEFYSKLPNNKTKFTVFRHSNVYGPYDKFDLEKSHVCAATITKVMKNDSGKVIVWGSGQEKRDLLYVDDFVDFIEACLVKQRQEYLFLNVGTANAVPIQSLVETAVSVSGKDLKIENDLTKPTIPTSLCLDYTKAKNTLGWSPKTSLREGLKKTMDWYKENY